MPKVSVLTPIYNVARYLPQCLDTLKAQTLADIEFICINDGSTDESLDILEGYAAGDSRFKVLDKQNEGYGMSMNRGLAIAQGEYVGILEPDDFIATDAFERLYRLAKRNGDCDVVKANYYTFDEARGERFVENLPGDLCGRVMDPSAPGNTRIVMATPAIWSAIYRRDFLAENGIGFLKTPGASFQDTGFVMKCFIAAEKVYCTHDAFIRYRVDNPGSSVKARNKVFNVCEEYHSIEAFLREHPQKRPSLITAVNAAKFNTYRWNTKRIDWDLRPEFLEVFAREFRAARDAGELDESLSAPSRWREFNEIANDPEGYCTRTRTRHALVALEKKLSKAAKCQACDITLIAPFRSFPGVAASPWTAFDLLCKQGKLSFKLVLPRSWGRALEVPESPAVSFVEDGDAGSILDAALPVVSTPYVAVLEERSYFDEGALGKLLAALEKSQADFAVGPLYRLGQEKTHKLNTSRLLFGKKREGRPLPASLNAVDATLGNKLFRTEALQRLDGPLDVGRLYAELSFERVPKAHVLTELRDGELLDRVSWPLRLLYHFWFRKLRP